MTRLIDADYLIDDIEHCLWDWESVDGITASTVLKQTITDIKNQPTIDAVQVVRCEDCLFGHLCFDVQNGVTDSWVDCRNPEGLYRDVSLDGYCSASIRRK